MNPAHVTCEIDKVKVRRDLRGWYAQRCSLDIGNDGRNAQKQEDAIAAIVDLGLVDQQCIVSERGHARPLLSEVECLLEDGIQSVDFRGRLGIELPTAGLHLQCVGKESALLQQVFFNREESIEACLQL